MADKLDADWLTTTRCQQGASPGTWLLRLEGRGCLQPHVVGANRFNKVLGSKTNTRNKGCSVVTTPLCKVPTAHARGRSASSEGLSVISLRGKHGDDNIASTFLRFLLGHDGFRRSTP